MRHLLTGTVLAAGLLASQSATAQEGSHPGETVYQQFCAACHENSELTRAPDRETLAQFPASRIEESLVSGVMQAQGMALSDKQKAEVSAYLGIADVAESDWTTAMACPAERATPDLDGEVTVSGFGFDQQNTRRLSYEQAGLSAEDMTHLDYAWSIGFPNVVSMRSQAAVVGNTMFLPVGESGARMFAFDVSGEEPCIQWVHEAEAGARSSAAYGVLPDGTKALAVGDREGFVSLINAMDGELIWRKSAAIMDGSAVTGTPLFAGDRIVVPLSQFEITVAAQPDHLCCTTHGGVTALDAVTGDQIWQMHTMPDAEPVRDRGDGQMLWGPSGAPIWNSPSVDLERGLVFVGTGEATSPPAHENTDALIAIDLEDGSIRWSYQATENDIYLMGCRQDGSTPNCVSKEESVHRDVDFGASTVLVTTPSGRDLLLAGQKSGTVWALDPDTGEVVWRRDIGTGSPLGGIHWAITADDTHVYAPISLPGRSLPDQVVGDDIKPGLYALNLENGEIDWAFHTEPLCGAEPAELTPRCKFMFGLSGAPTMIGDYVVAGGLDGWLYVLDKSTGELVWKYQTAREYDALNGEAASGAAIDNASIVAVNGQLFVNSGYGLFGAGAGNVMVAFRPKTEE